MLADETNRPRALVTYLLIISTITSLPLTSGFDCIKAIHLSIIEMRLFNYFKN